MYLPIEELDSNFLLKVVRKPLKLKPLKLKPLLLSYCDCRQACKALSDYCAIAALAQPEQMSDSTHYPIIRYLLCTNEKKKFHQVLVSEDRHLDSASEFQHLADLVLPDVQLLTCQGFMQMKNSM